jgi:hypothetical protein
MTITSDTFTLDTSSLVAGGVSLLVSFIPFVGEKVSKAVTATNDFIKTALVKQSANNVCKFSPGITQFEALAQDAVIDSIYSKQEELSKIDPDNYILKSWSDKFKNLVAKTKDSIDTKLYGNRNETAMQKLGYKDSCDLIEKIASGKIYQGEFAVRITAEDKILRLTEATSEIIEKEIADWNKKYIAVSEVAVSEKSGCCVIFTADQIQYSNELLNYPELMQSSLQEYNLSQILDLSIGLDTDLITEAMGDNNHDLILAGLISLDQI